MFRFQNCVFKLERVLQIIKSVIRISYQVGAKVKKMVLFLIMLLSVSAFQTNAHAASTQAIHKVKFQLWYEGIKSQPKIEGNNKNISKTEPSKSVSKVDFVEELSRPMHLVLKKHQIILNQ